VTTTLRESVTPTSECDAKVWLWRQSLTVTLQTTLLRLFLSYRTCPWWDSNPQSLPEPVLETGVFANFTTGAERRAGSDPRSSRVHG
jgi:hypothetical protein